MTDRVLIIEGDPRLRRELTSALTEAGFVVADVSDILEANEIRELNPDIAIVDEVLPSGDGKGVCSLLYTVLNIPVILMGKESSGEAWMAAVQAGADFYFTKPSTHQELVARVKAILRRYKEAGLTLIEFWIIAAILCILVVVVIPKLLGWW